MYCGDFPDTSADDHRGFNLGSRSRPPRIRSAETAGRARAILLSDDVTLVRGNHQFGLGGSFMYGEHLTFSRWWGIGNMAFGGQATGLGLADFLTGRTPASRPPPRRRMRWPSIRSR